MKWADFKKFSKKQKQTILIGSLLIAVLLAGYYYFLIQPSINKLGELTPQVVQLRKDLTMVKGEIQHIAQTRLQAQQLDNKIQEYKKAIPMESDLSQLLNYLSTEARDANVTLLGIEPKKNSLITGSGFREISLILRAKGDYHSLGYFLNQLETGERYMKVENFELSADKKDLNQHPIELSLRTYASEQ